MYVSIHVCISLYMYIYIQSICIYTCPCFAYASLSIYIHTYKCKHVCMHMRMCISKCKHVCMNMWYSKTQGIGSPESSDLGFCRNRLRRITHIISLTKDTFNETISRKQAEGPCTQELRIEDHFSTARMDHTFLTDSKPETSNRSG